VHSFEVGVARVTDGGVEGAEDELGASEVDGIADQSVHDFHEGDLNRCRVLKHRHGMDAWGPRCSDGTKHALVEVAKGLSAKSGGAATKSGDFDVGAILDI
jgi:hypothetical protein